MPDITEIICRSYLHSCYIRNERTLSYLYLTFQVHYILAELCMGGMVLETNMTEILTRIEEQNKLEKQEVSKGQILIVYIGWTIGLPR